MTDRGFSDEIVNGLPGVFYLYDQEGRLLRWNKRHEEVTGYSAEELKHKFVLDFFEGEDRGVIAIAVERVFTEGKGDAEADLVTKDGRRIPYYLTGVATILDGQPHFLGLGLDVSEIKKTEAALRKSEARFKDMAELLPEIVYECDADGAITYVNQMALAKLGYSREDLEQGLHALEMLAPADRNRAQADLQALLMTTKSVHGEYTAVRKDGSTFPIIAYASPIMLEGKPVGLRGVVVDITDRVNMETRLNRRAGRIIRLHRCLLNLSKLDLADSSAQIREILRSDARAMRVERVSFWVFNESGTEIACEDLYTLIKDSHEEGGTLSAKDYPNYFAAIRESRAIAADKACEDPRTSEFAEGYLKPRGITSMLDASVWLHGKMVGVVCHEHAGPVRAWLPEEQDFAASIADMVSLTLETAERARVEEALHRSEKQFRDLVEHIPIGIYRSTPEGRMMMANSTMVKMLGYASFEDLARRDLEGECEEHQYARAAYRAKIEHEGRVVGLESVWRKSDGSLIHVRENARAVFDEAGQALYYEGSIEDISEHKWAEDALRQEAEFRRATVERAAEGLCVCHAISEFPYVRFTVWNERMTAITGYTMDGINAKGWYQSVYPDPHVRVRAVERMERMRLGDDMMGEEWEITRADGAKRIICISTSVLSSGGEEGHVLALMQDVTERKRAEQELRNYQEHLEELVQGRTIELERANKQLQEEIGERTKLEDDLIKARESAEAANRAKSTFLANMSHGIRTPMNAILGYTQILQRDAALGQVQRDYVDVINRSGEHLLGLINDVLEMSKIEAGHTTFNPQEFDFYALMDDIEAMFRVRTAERHVALEVTITGQVPRLLYADSAKVREVVINLLGNAVKFTENGEISVGISSLASSKDERDHMISIEVKDTGYGIAPEELDRAFEPFEQTRSGRYQVGGTGLGLPISREYARMMGGELVVESSLGKGSTFRFTFRARAAGGDDAAPIPKDSARQVTGLATDSPPKVLVVDDDEASREALALHLSLVGFCVRQAANGVEAVAAFDEWQPAAILMDLWMPEMDGLEAIRRIKATPRGVATPILTVTASVLEKSEQEAMAAGSDGFIRKPFAKAEVFGQLKRVLGIEYVYEEKPCQSRKDRTGQALPVSLPDGLVRELSEATECGDGVGLRKLVEEHRAALGPKLAGRLTDLVNHYEYDKVMELLGQQQTCGR
jgi:PAS domain S-box-containing protein